MYDVKMHLPQQIEYMLAAEREGELDKFEMAVYNLKEMFKMSRSMNYNGVIQDLNDYEKEREGNIEDENKNALERLKTSIEGKTYEEVLNHLQEIEGQREQAINKILLEYMSIVKTYVLGYMPQVKIEGYG